MTSAGSNIGGQYQKL